MLFLSGLKLLNVPEANWVLAGGLIAAMIGFGVLGADAASVEVGAAAAGSGRALGLVSAA